MAKRPANVSVRCEEDLPDRLSTLAEAHGETLSSVAAVALRLGLEILEGDWERFYAGLVAARKASEAAALAEKEEKLKFKKPGK